MNASNSTERPSGSLHSPDPRVAACVMSLFVLATLGAWAWFHVGVTDGPAGIRFDRRTVVEGFGSQPLDVSERERAILATTNLFSAVFTNSGDGRVTAFFAEWPGRMAREMVVVAHTPDICWAAAGATVSDVPHPRKLGMEFGGRTVPFECRVFQLPGSMVPEATVWCTLVGGRVLEEGVPWDGEMDVGAGGRDRSLASSRRKSWEAYWATVKSRRPGKGWKQFVRFSVPVKGDVDEALRRLALFGRQWLTVLEWAPGGERAGDRGAAQGVWETGPEHAFQQR